MSYSPSFIKVRCVPSASLPTSVSCEMNDDNAFLQLDEPTSVLDTSMNDTVTYTNTAYSMMLTQTPSAAHDSHMLGCSMGSFTSRPKSSRSFGSSSIVYSAQVSYTYLILPHTPRAQNRAKRLR